MYNINISNKLIILKIGDKVVKSFIAVLGVSSINVERRLSLFVDTDSNVTISEISTSCTKNVLCNVQLAAYGDLTATISATNYKSQNLTVYATNKFIQIQSSIINMVEIIELKIKDSHGMFYTSADFTIKVNGN
jgi:hypothetical protein